MKPNSIEELATYAPYMEKLCNVEMWLAFAKQKDGGVIYGRPKPGVSWAEWLAAVKDI